MLFLLQRNTRSRVYFVCPNHGTLLQTEHLKNHSLSCDTLYVTYQDLRATENQCLLRTCSSAIFYNTEITITTSYRRDIAVDKPFFMIAVEAIHHEIQKIFFHLFISLG